jgi:hypothetical protein
MLEWPKADRGCPESDRTGMQGSSLRVHSDRGATRIYRIRLVYSMLHIPFAPPAFTIFKLFQTCCIQHVMARHPPTAELPVGIMLGCKFPPPSDFEPELFNLGSGITAVTGSAENEFWIGEKTCAPRACFGYAAVFYPMVLPISKELV